MHEDEVTKMLGLGMAAEWLLDNGTFKDTIADIKQAYTQIIVGSNPGDTAKREHAYLVIRALGDIESLLQARKTAKDQYVLNSEQQTLF